MILLLKRGSYLCTSALCPLFSSSFSAEKEAKRQVAKRRLELRFWLRETCESFVLEQFGYSARRSFLPRFQALGLSSFWLTKFNLSCCWYYSGKKRRAFPQSHPPRAAPPFKALNMATSCYNQFTHFVKLYGRPACLPTVGRYTVRRRSLYLPTAGRQASLFAYFLGDCKSLTAAGS